MHKIFWDMGIVSMLTSDIDAKEHKHWMLQLFYLPSENSHLNVEGEDVDGRLIVVNKNCNHSFQTNGRIHFSMLIIPGTKLCEHICHSYLNNKSYYDFTYMLDLENAKTFDKFVRDSSVDGYKTFKKYLLDILSFDSCCLSHKNDSRVQAIVEHFTKGNISITEISEELSLSPSRVAHVFKEQTGTPLKSYLLLSQMYIAFENLFGGKTITDAAMDAGFDSPSHFAATTKKLLGESASMSLKDSEFLKVF